MLIILDFDGVLHPQYEGQATPNDLVFCHLPRIEPVFREYDVEIVISSTWRIDFTLERLKEHFSPDIREKIIGATPVLDAENGQFIPYRREKEILAWLTQNSRAHEDWLALDDAAWQFGVHRDKLIACIWNQGFDEKAEAELRMKLEAQLPR
jgi:hypothetical protein